MRTQRKYSGTPISLFLKTPDNLNQKLFPLDLFHCNFTPDISNLLISQTNFCFPWRFEKSGFHCLPNRHQAQENACDQVAIGFGLASNWFESFTPIRA